MSRNSANRVVDNRRSPYASSSMNGSTSTACVGSSASTTRFKISGTLTLASLAATRNTSATATRPLNSHKYGSNSLTVRQPARGTGAASGGATVVDW